jgi:hypothetical protein
LGIRSRPRPFGMIRLLLFEQAEPRDVPVGVDLGLLGDG